MKDKEKKDNPKAIERFSLSMRKRWLINGTKTLLIVAILIAAFIALNLWVQELDLPIIDVTENKIYTLSEASIKAIQNINQDIKIYIYGYDEKASLVDFIKQYAKANEHITYEILTEESNYAKVQEYELNEGYYILILESGESKKVIDGSSEFYSYDYTTYQEVDITEQTITNSILGLITENKPKVYFMQGHGEYATSELAVLATYLTNESFEVNELNILTNGTIPEDCDVLAIMSPTSDLYDSEAQVIKDYINKGGNIFYTMDVVSEETSFTNLHSVLDLYGVRVENGYIMENDSNYTLSNYPNIFMPQVSGSSNITQDIYTDSYMWLVYAARLQFLSDEELESLNVTKEDLLYSTENSLFTTDLSSSMTAAATSAQKASSVIASLVTKVINSGTETEITSEETTDETNSNSEEEITVESKLIIVSTGSFISDYTISALSESYPLSYLGSNKDFVINSIAELSAKEGGLSIRKDMSASTYAPTETQNKIVLAVIFIIPILIILIGIVIWNYRKRRK